MILCYSSPNGLRHALTQAEHLNQLPDGVIENDKNEGS